MGLPKVIGLVDGILFVAGVPLLNMAHQKDAKASSKTIIDMCAEFQHFDVNDVTNVGGFIAVMKQGDVLTIPAGCVDCDRLTGGCVYPFVVNL